MSDHERFIVGQGESGRVYVTHTRFPRFVAELFDDEEGGWVAHGGLSLALPETGETLANFVWVDDPPPGAIGVARALRDDVAAFLLESDFRAERDADAARRADGEEE